jgi:sec-independent protein translocase protein TatA
MAGLTPAHLIIVLIIALIVIGPGKLPEVGAAMGKSIREFQNASKGLQETAGGSVAPVNGAAPAAPIAPAQVVQAPVAPDQAPVQ